MRALVTDAPRPAADPDAMRTDDRLLLRVCARPGRRKHGKAPVQMWHAVTACVEGMSKIKTRHLCIGRTTRACRHPAPASKRCARSHLQASLGRITPGAFFPAIARLSCALQHQRRTVFTSTPGLATICAGTGAAFSNRANGTGRLRRPMCTDSGESELQTRLLLQWRCHWSDRRHWCAAYLARS